MKFLKASSNWAGRTVKLRLLLCILFASTPAHGLRVGNNVTASPESLNVRVSPAGSILGTQSRGTAGTIVGGPVTATLSGTSYVWWQVDWTSGPDGWSFEGGLAQATLTYGIDVSNHQGVIDWPLVAADNVDFAFAKATEGTTFIDARFTGNMNAGKAAGIRMGAYHFARPSSTPTVADDARAEARHFMRQLHPWLGQGMLAPVLDLEDGSAMGKTTLSTWTRIFCQEMQRLTGAPPIIYTSRSYAQTLLDADIANYPLWVAVPNTTPGQDDFNLGIWSDWTFQQYSWVGSVLGIAGDVDLNAFRGDLLDMDAYTLPPLTHTLSQASVLPATAARGRTVTLQAQVQSARGRSLLLGASLFPAGSSTGGVSDGVHDLLLTLPTASAQVQRPFALPATLAPGKYDLWLALYVDLDGSGGINSGDLAVGSIYKQPNAFTVLTQDFTTWAASQNLNGAQANPLADPDGDGLKNLTEYGLGLLPGIPQRSPVQIDRINGQIRLRFPRYADRADLTYSIEGSANMLQWTTLTSSTAGAAFPPALVQESGTAPVNVTYLVPAGANAPRYLRLRITSTAIP
jgi:GH25 family lysozyme M1 (1,4-beta-N-acetylmuramidase)